MNEWKESGLIPSKGSGKFPAHHYFKNLRASPSHEVFNLCYAGF